jgi:hypothetical protein
MASICSHQSDAINRTIALRLNLSGSVMHPNSIKPPYLPTVVGRRSR